MSEQKKSRVDDILVGIQTGNQELQKGRPPEVSNEKLTGEKPVPQPVKTETLTPKPVEEKLTPVPVAPKPKPPVEPEQLPAAAKSAVPEENEYGIPDEKKPEKTYTQSEVESMMRERLARVKQPTQQEVKEIAKDFKADPQSAEDWETQLESFVDKTIEKREQKARERQWREQEDKIQLEFENKMNSASMKYSDFWPTLNTAPITPSIMIAARAMDAPHDFLYAAAKLRPDELRRISQITDPIKQTVEVGRLEASMRQSSRTTKAPRPLEQVTGDYVEREKEEPKAPSIDQRILLDAQKKMGRR